MRYVLICTLVALSLVLRGVVSRSAPPSVVVSQWSEADMEKKESTVYRERWLEAERLLFPDLLQGQTPVGIQPHVQLVYRLHFVRDLRVDGIDGQPTYDAGRIYQNKAPVTPRVTTARVKERIVQGILTTKPTTVQRAMGDFKVIRESLMLASVADSARRK